MGRKSNRRQGNTDIIAPPPEQAGAFELVEINDKRRGGGTITIGKAHRRKPMIDTLLAQGVISLAQHKALRHYRHHADIADRSLVRDSLCFQRGGSGNGPTITTLNAVRLVADVEAAAGSVRDILRAVVVYDQSLSQWAMDRAGSIERRDVKRRTPRIEARPHALAAARLEMRVAAQRVQAELDA